MQMTWQKMPYQRKNARGRISHVKSMRQQLLSTHKYHKKTEVVHLAAPGKPDTEPTITVNGQNFKLLINSPIFEALSPEHDTLIMR